MSTVQVDPAQLDAEATLIASEHEAANPPTLDPLAPELPPVPDLAQQRAGYRMLAFALADRASSVLLPAWEIQPEENGTFADACAEALVLWFPDQLIPPKYMALLVLAGVSLEIVEKRRDPVTGKLRPTRHAAKPKADDTAPAASTAEAA